MKLKEIKVGGVFKLGDYSNFYAHFSDENRIC